MKPRYAGKYRLDDQDMQDDYDQAERNEYGELSERIFFFCSRRSLPNILSNGLVQTANVGHLLGVARTAHWQDANRMAIGNHALHPVLSFRAEARPHHDLSTGEVLPSDPRCFIPQADEGARATAPTRPDHFPAPSFPTTDRWCYKHRSVPAFVRLLTAASVTLSRDIRHTPISLVFLLRGVICYRLSGGYPLT
jgi:hypothetical protein